MSKSGGNEIEEAPSLTPAEALSQCLLSRYTFCAAGIGFGVAYAIKTKKGLMPMVIGGFLGTVADLAYGYQIGCAAEIKRFRQQKE